MQLNFKQNKDFLFVLEVFGGCKTHESHEFMKVDSVELHIRINSVILLSRIKCCFLSRMVWNVVLQKCSVVCSVSYKHFFNLKLNNQTLLS